VQQASAAPAAQPAALPRAAHEELPAPAGLAHAAVAGQHGQGVFKPLVLPDHHLVEPLVLCWVVAMICLVDAASAWLCPEMVPTVTHSHIRVRALLWWSELTCADSHLRLFAEVRVPGR